VALLLGCGAGADDGALGASDGALSPDDGAIGTCIAEHPPAEPFDLGDTESGRATPAPEPGGEPIIPPPLTPADIAQSCREGGGSGCDEQAFISRDAADCIARDAGLATGIQPWNTSLNYFQNHQRVGWGIMTVRESTSDGYWGESLVLDATTGAELARTTYRATGD
jgi:hypothetical protein